MASRKPLLIAFATAFGLFPLPSLSAVWTSLDGSKALVRNSSGAVVRLQVPSVLPSVAAGGGAASLKASQALVIGNSVAALQLSRNVPLLNVAKLARIAAWGVGPVALLGLALDAYQYVDGVWHVEEEQTRYTFGGTVEAFTLQQALDHYAATAPQYAPGVAFGRDVWGVSSPVRICSAGWPGNACQFWQKGGTTTTEQVPTDEASLEAAIAAALQAQPSLAGQVLDRALEDSQARAQLAADPLGITGPSTVDGGSTTSTRVDTAGTTTIQTQTTYNLSYQGDTVNLTQTQVETVTDPANNVTTTTTTTDAPTGDAPPPDEPPDLCAENPDASGCAPFGTPEPPTPLPEEDRTVSFAPEMSAAGACPAPQAFSIAGQSFQLTYDGACEFAQGIRPVVLAVAWMGAFVFLFSIGRAQTS